VPWWLNNYNWVNKKGTNNMDIESPEAADVLLRSVDANAKALKDLIQIVKKLKEDMRELKKRVEKLENL
jgi:hypothetical protein